MKLLLFLLTLSMLVACEKPSAIDPGDSIPACLGEYSKRGNQEALDALLEEYQVTIGLVSDNDDMFLITDIQNVKGDFLKMEDWVCRAQRKYGVPRGKLVASPEVSVKKIINRKDVIAHVNRATNHHKKGEPGKAIEAFSRAIAIDPKDDALYFMRGSMYGLKGEHDKAISDFSKAIIINPRHATTYSSRGIDYSLTGEFAKAIEDFSKALAIDPKDTRVYLSRGFAYNAIGDYGKAIGDYSKLISTNPENAEAYYYRAEAYRANGKPDKAEADEKMYRSLSQK